LWIDFVERGDVMTTTPLFRYDRRDAVIDMRSEMPRRHNWLRLVVWAVAAFVGVFLWVGAWL
jgi:hypothetical protein